MLARGGGWGAAAFARDRETSRGWGLSAPRPRKPAGQSEGAGHPTATKTSQGNYKTGKNNRLSSSTNVDAKIPKKVFANRV